MADRPSNPFFFAGRVERPEDFYGRKEELRSIFRLLGAAQPMSISVVGERRIGKSSLLWYLHQKGPEQLGSEWRFAYVALDSLGDLTMERVLVAMAAGLNESLAELTYEGFSQLVGRLASQGQRLVFCLDEFEAVTALGEAFLGYLRGLINVNQVTFIVATERPLEELSREGVLTSPFFNVFTKVPLGPMPDDEARELLSRRGALAFPEPEIAAALREARGHPFLLQQWGYRLYEKHYGKAAEAPPLIRPRVTLPPREAIMPSLLWWAVLGYAIALLGLIVAGLLPSRLNLVASGVAVLAGVAAFLLTMAYVFAPRFSSPRGGPR